MKKLILCLLLLTLTGHLYAFEKLDKHFDYAANRYGVDVKLLKAISHVESHKHPWTLGIAGEPFFFENREEMARMLQQYQDKPWLVRYKSRKDSPVFRKIFATKAEAHTFRNQIKHLPYSSVKKLSLDNIDVGPMQVNWRWHKHEVKDIRKLFDLRYNISYAARMLSRLIAKYGVEGAVKRYHAGESLPEESLKRAQNYLGKVREAYWG